MENNNQNKTDYYKDQSKKISDFFTGFGIITASAFIFFIISMIIPSYLSLWVYLFPILVAIGGIYIAKKKHRKYIIIGIISAILLPFLFFGACSIILRGISG